MLKMNFTTICREVGGNIMAVLEVKINREIRNYKEKIFFGFTLKQTIFAIAGVDVGAISYFVLSYRIGGNVASYVSMLLAVPFFVFGFKTKYGMSYGEYIRAKLISKKLEKLKLEDNDNNYLYTISKRYYEMKLNEAAIQQKEERNAEKNEKKRQLKVAQNNTGDNSNQANL